MGERRHRGCYWGVRDGWGGLTDVLVSYWLLEVQI